MKSSDTFANKDGRLERSAAHFDTSELREGLERKDDSVDQIMDHPIDNIDEVSMAISHHVQTPNKITDFRNNKPTVLPANKTARKRGSKFAMTDQKNNHSKNANTMKKETKYMAISLSNEHM